MGLFLRKRYTCLGPTSKHYLLPYFLWLAMTCFWFLLLSLPDGATAGGSIHRGYRLDVVALQHC